MSASAQKKGLRGYVTSRPFGGFVIPVPLQSLALRDYCGRKSMLYVLPVNENSFPHSYMVLEGLVTDLAAYEGVIMYSMHMLPERAARRLAIYHKILGQGCALHLVLEDMVIGRPGDIGRIEELLVFARLANAAKVPTLE
jgi:sporadic carbohydrate cluster protein (TIGR04323 family)